MYTRMQETMLWSFTCFTEKSCIY